MFETRISACLAHLLIGTAVFLYLAGFVFGVWYPPPTHQLANGVEIFLLILVVDLFCGPLLTLVVFNKVKKSAAEIRRDLVMIGAIQIGALVYGLTVLSHARPAFIAFEGDRFRVVSLADIDARELEKSEARSKDFPWLGPKLVGVKLLKPTDPGYLQSIERAIQGDHPIPYVNVVQDVKSALIPVAALISSGRVDKATQSPEIFAQLQRHQHDFYLPIVGRNSADWIAILPADGESIIGYLPIDGW